MPATLKIMIQRKALIFYCYTILSTVDEHEHKMEETKSLQWIFRYVALLQSLMAF